MPIFMRKAGHLEGKYDGDCLTKPADPCFCIAHDNAEPKAPPDPAQRIFQPAQSPDLFQGFGGAGRGGMPVLV